MCKVVSEHGPRCYLDMAEGLHHQVSRHPIELIEADRILESRLIAEVMPTRNTLGIKIAHEAVVADTLQVAIGVGDVADGQPALLEEIQLLLNRQGGLR